MNTTDEIHARLVAAFDAARLEVINESHLHAGHAGDDGSGESHFRVVLYTAAFQDMSRLKRHRAVHAAIGGALMGRIHALALDLQVPG